MVVRILFSFLMLCSTTLCCALSCRAQQGLDYAVNPKRGSIRTTFSLAITVQGDASTPHLESDNDFHVRYIGPEQRVSIINGAISQQKTFRYKATPKKEGTLRLPEFHVTIEGFQEVTPPLTVEVSQASLDTQQAEEDDVRIEDSVSKATVYEGEQLLLTTEVMTVNPLQNIELHKSSRANFWSQEIKPEERDQDLRRGATVSILRFKHALFPLTSGVLSIEPTVLSAQVSRSKVGDLFDSIDPFSNNFMRGMFSLDLEPITLATKPTKLTVLPLPPIDPSLTTTLAPKLTGRTVVSAQVDKTTTDPNDEAILTIAISTEGNGNLLNNLSLGSHPSFEAVRDNQKLTYTLSGNTIQYLYTAQFRIVPKVNGSFIVPAQTLAFFNTDTHQYEVASSQAITMTGINTVEQPKATPQEESLQPNTTQDDAVFSQDTEHPATGRLNTHQIIILILCGAIALLSLRLWKLQNARTVPTPSSTLRSQRTGQSFTDARSFLTYLEHLAQQSFGGTCTVRGFLEKSLGQRSEKLTTALQALSVIEEAVYAPDPAVTTELFIEYRDKLLEIIGT
jgi:hypothetical protein